MTPYNLSIAVYVRLLGTPTFLVFLFEIEGVDK